MRTYMCDVRVPETTEMNHFDLQKCFNFKNNYSCIVLTLRERERKQMEGENKEMKRKHSPYCVSGSCGLMMIVQQGFSWSPIALL